MEGVNTLILNAATMREVVQLWMDKAMTDPPRVKSVKALSDPGGVPRFEITFEPPKEPSPMVVESDS